MSRISDQIRAYVDDLSVSNHYGAWGALHPDQRRLIRTLCDVCDMYEKTADLAVAEREANVKGFTEEIKRMNVELEAMRGAANSYKMHYESAKREVATLEKEIKALVAFKEYFSELYGQGLDIAKWHENGTLEPFDNFYDAAEDEYENAKERVGKDTNVPTKVSSGDICVVCGEIVPEGRQVCGMCEVGQRFMNKRKGEEFGEQENVFKKIN